MRFPPSFPPGLGARGVAAAAGGVVSAAAGAEGEPDVDVAAAAAVEAGPEGEAAASLLLPGDGPAMESDMLPCSCS